MTNPARRSTGVPFLNPSIIEGRLPSLSARFCTETLMGRPIDDHVVVPTRQQHGWLTPWTDERWDENEACVALLCHGGFRSKRQRTASPFARPMGARKNVRSKPMQARKPTPEEIAARLEAVKHEAEAAMRATRAELLEKLRTAGIGRIEAQYDGYGDSGNVNEISGGMSESLEEAVASLIYTKNADLRRDRRSWATKPDRHSRSSLEARSRT